MILTNNIEMHILEIPKIKGKETINDELYTKVKEVLDSK